MKLPFLKTLEEFDFTMQRTLRAQMHGYDALFTTAAELFEDIHTAATRGRLSGRL